jgi:hypothetical protein
MLASKGFTHRIDCTASPSNGMPGGQILVHLITVRDKPDEADNLWSKLEEGCDFIESAIASKYVIFLFFFLSSFLNATSTWYSCSATVYNQGMLTTTTKFVLPFPHFSFTHSVHRVKFLSIALLVSPDLRLSSYTIS